MTRIIPLSPQAARWGDFDCGDEQITGKLAREAMRAGDGLQSLYGVVDESGEVLAALTLRAGVLAAPSSVLYELGQGELDVPTVHLEVLAVHRDAQGQGYGRNLITFATQQAQDVRLLVGVRTLSLEATPQSRPFYQRLGFRGTTQAWPGGSWPMWLLLGF
ncbi:hypothetical protein DESA109040_14960 [Deinococcus saxicola]|uniref:GNAT family N-acetyltransferase n=1 Tax=Deinococcus saxicola TaxID=249406 RepID=UPI0039EDE99D